MILAMTINVWDNVRIITAVLLTQCRSSEWETERGESMQTSLESVTHSLFLTSLQYHPPGNVLKCTHTLQHTHTHSHTCALHSHIKGAVDVLLLQLCRASSLSRPPWAPSGSSEMSWVTRQTAFRLCNKLDCSAGSVDVQRDAQEHCRKC